MTASPWTRGQRVLMLATAVVAALIVIPFASAWTWGYNYIGSGVNENVVAGWNYWDYTSADKRSGDRVVREWKVQSGGYCLTMLDGVTTHFSTPGGCGYGGYVYLRYYYGYGNSSYIYVEAY